ncbi:ammonium transporter [Phaffia rhodozyma]|uniref:Ammonium transporter n=1 Tax=Phaffia rhodozyma TaxID=264483 RepID=A0A0F7SN95_PHARH|nr:ammonium transporter [Phaffia rhodozyma]CED83532.1 ammonium transporter [Phaffia rhodozyma]
MATVAIKYTADENIIALGYDNAVYNLGDISWILTSTALVWLMIPGLAFFYSGLVRRKNALSFLFLGMAGLSVVSFQWFFWGFSLAFSETGSAYIGDLKYFAMRNVLDAPSIGSTRIPSSLFAVYQCMFAALTPIIAVGGFAERCRMGPVLVFIFIWSTLVYDPIACWTWNSNGWIYVMGGLDFAGGSPVHISSGTAALAIALYLGKRRGYGTERLAYKPHNTSYVILGTAFLWFGWFGFNGGSALSANLRAVSACIVTNLAASVGGLTWMILDYRLEKKWSAVGFCSGAVSGLVAITPASGFVGAPAALVFGVVGGAVCNYATRIKFLIGVDEALDVFAGHGLGGIAGNLMTALFAQASIASLDGFSEIPGGWIDHHYVQLGYQLADSVACVSYSFVMTTIILWIMHYIPGLRLRCSEESEIVGLDDAELGEFSYDYVGLDPEARLIHHEGRVVVTSDAEHKQPNVIKPEDHSESSLSSKPQGNEKAGGAAVDA